MNIINPTPIVIPPSDEKVYPDQWIRQLHVYCPSTTTTGRIQIDLLPYNYQTKELLDTVDAESLVLDVWEGVGNIPELQQIFGLIIQSIPVVRDYINKTGRYASPVVLEPQTNE